MRPDGSGVVPVWLFAVRFGIHGGHLVLIPSFCQIRSFFAIFRYMKKLVFPLLIIPPFNGTETSFILRLKILDYQDKNELPIWIRLCITF